MNDYCIGCTFEMCDIVNEPCSSCDYGSKRCEMTPNEYQTEALRTAGKPDILNGVMGLCGESGECIDLVKKSMFQCHELDKEHLAKELGDVAWYLAVTAMAIGYDLETILQTNVKKLRDRYPYGFDSEKSKHRKDGDV